MAIIDNIKKIRKLTGLNQFDFASVMRTSEQVQKNYESGRTEPEELYVEKLADLFQIPLQDLKNGRLRNEILEEKVQKVRERNYKPADPEGIISENNQDLRILNATVNVLYKIIQEQDANHQALLGYIALHGGVKGTIPRIKVLSEVGRIRGVVAKMLQNKDTHIDWDKVDMYEHEE